MQHIWTPWRYKYISSVQNHDGCIFCIAKECPDNKDCFVLHKGSYNLILLNIFPYTSGHLMIAPFQHIASPAESAAEQLQEMIQLMTKCMLSLKKTYKPGGFNIGMNIGKCAGAGLSDHFHLHILPRWEGDTNFMASLAETRLIPESLDDTYNKLLSKFNEP